MGQHKCTQDGTALKVGSLAPGRRRGHNHDDRQWRGLSNVMQTGENQPVMCAVLDSQEMRINFRLIKKRNYSAKEMRFVRIAFNYLYLKFLLRRLHSE